MAEIRTTGDIDRAGDCGPRKNAGKKVEVVLMSQILARKLAGLRRFVMQIEF